MPPRRRPLSHHSDDGSLYANLGLDTGISFAKAYFPKARKELLIATAYFSVKGYDMARSSILKKTPISVLIGPHKRDSEKLKRVIIDEIRRELSGVDSASLYEAVLELHARLQSGLFRIAEARQMKTAFHCKFYIVHSRLLWHGSANFSFNGLKNQYEQATIVREAKVVAEWKAWFKQEAAAAKDINAEVLQTLEDYLNMARPFDVYLKALFLLLRATNIQREFKAHTPVYYQQHLATCAVRQIDAYGGALMVMATGLGKTIVGAEVAGILCEAKETQHVVLLAPNSVHELWGEQLRGRGVSHTMFDYKILFQPSRKRRRDKISQLLGQLQQANEKLLLVIDEAHVYRNQLSSAAAKKGQLALKRVSAATARGMRVLLLTGSAYCTSTQNLDSLLSFLPRTDTRNLLDKDVWKTESCKTFSMMPPVVVFSYPHVIEIARRRGDIEEGYPYVEYGGARRYIPTRINTQFVTFDLPEELAISEAFEAGCFNQDKRMPFKSFDDEQGEVDAATDGILNNTLVALLSSIPVFMQCIDDNLKTPGALSEPSLFEDLQEGNDSNHEPTSYVQKDLFNAAPAKVFSTSKQTAAKAYKTVLKHNLQVRFDSLDGIRRRLKSLKSKPDDKALKLIGILRSHKKKAPLKAIIFVGRHATARYLTRMLRSRLKSCKIACTVSKRCELKPLSLRSEILSRFSPMSHGLPDDGSRIDVLVCTDADGISINLQDANIVVNYDLSPGADVLVQRLGRVLRATPQRGRDIYVFTFVPACLNDLTKQGMLYRCIRDRYERIFSRHEKSSEILESSVLPNLSGSEIISLDQELDIDKELSSYETLVAHNRKDSLASYISDLEAHRKEAKALPCTLHSAREYRGKAARLVVVVRHGHDYHALVADPCSGQIVSEDPLEALALLACAPNTPRADAFSINVPKILELAGAAVTGWGNQKGLPLSGLERLLTLYLLPARTEENVE